MNISAGQRALPSVDTRTGSFTAQSVVVATGGLSIPKMGATGVGYDIARSFGHTLVEPRAGLVPLVSRTRRIVTTGATSPGPFHRGHRASAPELKAKCMCVAALGLLHLRFARSCSSPTAVSAARRCCKFLPTGSRASHSFSTSPQGSKSSRHFSPAAQGGMTSRCCKRCPQFCRRASQSAG